MARAYLKADVVTVHEMGVTVVEWMDIGKTGIGIVE